MSYADLRRGRYSEPGRAYFVTTVTAARRPVFVDFRTARAVIAQMRALDASGAIESLAWVLMPDHLHWLLALRGDATLAQLMHQLKGSTAREVNRLQRSRGTLWQRAYHDHALRDDEDVQAIARYIVANPLRAGLVRRLGDYPHWDATWL
ncbi:transposase [Nevskia sp.]|uniref:REP-associated tyrosine transposase n=1 Tax=Nevskia sp. TaxID=1929292 RepID=UPI0025FB9D20|nr:transposase [Nevskia sp.]